MLMRSQRAHAKYHALPGTQLSVEAKKTNFAILVTRQGLYQDRPRGQSPNCLRDGPYHRERPPSDCPRQSRPLLTLIFLHLSLLSSILNPLSLILYP